MAATIRDEFAQAASGGGEDEDFVPELPPAPVVKRKVSQEAFDDVVRENVDEFEMGLAEAMLDAVAQFTRQDVDLSLLVTSPHGRAVDAAMAAQAGLLEAAVKACDVAALAPLLDALAASAGAGDEERVAAGRHGALGAATFCCKRFPEHEVAVVAALRLGAELLKAPANREIIPFAGLEAVSGCLQRYPESAAVQAAGLALCLQAITKHEANKRNLKDVNINARLLRALRATTHKEVVSAACRFLRVYLSDDDRRPGVQPGTFARARELGEDFDNGVLPPLIALLNDTTLAADGQMVLLGLSTLKAVAVNDLICKHVSNKGGLEVALAALEAYLADAKVAGQGSSLLRAVSRNDDIKRTVGKGKGLGLLLRALDEHSNDVYVCVQSLQCLSVLCLRMPDNCETIAGLGCLQLIVAAMTTHPTQAAVQRPAIATMRNMVSSWQNKDLTQQILDHGAEPLIREARRAHPEDCEEVAYAALRDLGVEYQSK